MPDIYIYRVYSSYQVPPHTSSYFSRSAHRNSPRPRDYIFIFLKVYVIVYPTCPTPSANATNSTNSRSNTSSKSSTREMSRRRSINLVLVLRYVGSTISLLPPFFPYIHLSPSPSLSFDCVFPIKHYPSTHRIPMYQTRCECFFLCWNEKAEYTYCVCQAGLNLNLFGALSGALSSSKRKETHSKPDGSRHSIEESHDKGMYICPCTPIHSTPFINCHALDHLARAARSCVNDIADKT